MKRKSNGSRLILIAAACGAALSIPVWREVFNQRAEARTAKLATQAVGARKSDLLEQQANFDNPARREELMRASGYVREGEVRIEGETK